MSEHKFVALAKEDQRLICQGDWIVNHFIEIKKELKAVHWPNEGNLIIDGHDISKIDSAGVWLLNRWVDRLTSRGLTITLENFSKQTVKLIEIIRKREAGSKKTPKVKRDNLLVRIGKSTINQLFEIRDYLTFTGRLTFEFLRTAVQPWRWRWNSLSSTIERTGVDALPIIALLSFMIGIVISYQMGNQLRAYGANVFIVDLLGLSVLREFGPLITAIMVAGRTGSSFTAQLGIMKINQEIDALDTMGVTPAELLLLPRLIGLVIVLPLLTIWADIFGVFGGMIMANNMLDISWYDFLQRFQQEIPVRSLIIGLGKAPVFALLIGSIGCFEGMQVRGSAESVGLLTTRSVVLSIFFIIVSDAIFSVIFSRLQL